MKRARFIRYNIYFLAFMLFASGALGMLIVAAFYTIIDAL